MLRPYIAVVLILLWLPIFGRADEFRIGRGGFAITVDTDSYLFGSLSDSLDTYRLFGYSFAWRASHYKLLVSNWTVSTSTGSLAPDTHHAAILLRRKEEIIREVGTKLGLAQFPYAFEKEQGFELRSSNPAGTVVRDVYIGKRLYELLLIADSPEYLPEGIHSLDSLRRLTKEEQMVALIEESAPHALAQDRPKDLTWSDTSELGLSPGVKRVRDTDVDSKGVTNIVQEIHFDEHGFKTREITFNQGYPDVITAWGWRGIDRINLQSPVNYPFGDGPVGGRTEIVSGYAGVGKQPAYGNKIVVKTDGAGRIIGREFFSNNGILGYRETYTYTPTTREISTTDSRGGFVSRLREHFDSNHRVIQSEDLTDQGVGSPVIHEYTFDTKGNWVTRKDFYPRSGPHGVKKLVRTINRQILYYDKADPNVVG